MTTPKIILVTGASQGIGRACADLLHEQSRIVYGACRMPARVTAPWKVIEIDVTKDDSVARCVAQVIAEQGRIDVLVNNAGVVLAGAVEDTSLEEAQSQFDTNFFGALRLIRAVLPTMRVQKSGLIVNVSSLAGLLGMPFQGLYSASKFALEGLTESLRPEVAPFGIEVVLVEPGDIATSVVENRRRARASGPGSVYREDFDRVMALCEKEEKAGAAPDVVARRIAAIIDTSRPAVRYTSGALSQRFLVALKPYVPSRLLEAGLMKFYGLRRK